MIRTTGLVVVATLLAIGTARAGTATFHPAAFDFGDVPLFLSSLREDFSLANTGTDDLVVSSLAVDAPFRCPDLPAVPLTLPPGATAGFWCVFEPTQAGSSEGAVTVVSSDPASPTVLALRGNGVPGLGLYTLPNPIRFGDTRIPPAGQAGPVRTVAIQSNINQPIVIQQLTPAGSPAFALLTPPSLPLVIPPMGNLLLRFQFTPTARGDAQGSITVVSDAPNAPTTVSLRGTGVSPTLGVATDVAFPAVNVGQVVASSLVVTNPGDATLTITQASFGGASAAEFSSPTTFPLTIAPAASASIMLAFAPTAAGARAATVTLASDDPFAPTVDVALAGRGTTPTIALTPDRLDFGDVVIGTPAASRSIAIANAGDGPLRITGVDSSSALFRLEPLALPLTLAAGASQAVSVGFVPAGAGPASATLTITSDDAAAPQKTVALAGVGARAPASDGGCALAPDGAPWPALWALAGLLLLRRRRRSRSA